MPTIGTKSKPGVPSSGWIAYWRSSSENQEAMLFTMPERGRITKVGFWGRHNEESFGGNVQFKVCVWARGANSSSGNDLIGESAPFNVSAGPFTYAGQLSWEADLLEPIELNAGQQFYAGFWREANRNHTVLLQNVGNHIHRRRNPGPSDMNGHDGHSGGTSGMWADYEPAQEVYVRRGNAWVRAEGAFVRRGSVWVPADVAVRRSGSWQEV